METAEKQAQLLRLYVLELKGCLQQMDALSVFQRNPYLRSPRAKKLLDDVCESMQHCLDAAVVFMAGVSRTKLYDAAALKGYHGACQILFDFQDALQRQEILHLLLVRDRGVQQRLTQFLTVSERMAHMVLQQHVERSA